MFSLHGAGAFLDRAVPRLGKGGVHHMLIEVHLLVCVPRREVPRGVGGRARLSLPPDPRRQMTARDKLLSLRLPMLSRLIESLHNN